jgi:hypothetical protein
MPKANFVVKVILIGRCARQAQGTGHRAQGKKNKRKLIFSLRLAPYASSLN